MFNLGGDKAGLDLYCQSENTNEIKKKTEKMLLDELIFILSCEVRFGLNFAWCKSLHPNDVVPLRRFGSFQFTPNELSNCGCE